MKKILGMALIILVVGNFVHKNNRWATSRDYNKYLEKSAITLIDKSQDKGYIDINDVDAISYVNEMPPKEELPIISMATPGIIDAVNEVKPGRLDSSKIERYDKYDKQILNALDKLKEKGENPDANIIKIIMVIETGMNPVKNSLGFEGFPQTKKYIVDHINKKYHTHFTMADMYKAGPSAQFIYYYMKSVFQSDFVNDIPDMLIAYNWGVTNLARYKKGTKKLPNQSRDYVSMYNAMSPFVDELKPSPQS